MEDRNAAVNMQFRENSGGRSGCLAINWQSKVQIVTFDKLQIGAGMCKQSPIIFPEKKHNGQMENQNK